MTRKKAIRYVDLPDREIARLLGNGYARLAEYPDDPDNVQNRIRDLHASITEAIRRLKKRNT